MLVNSVMTRSVVTVDPGWSLHVAARLMREGRFRHLPVVRAERLVGIISDREAVSGGDTRVSEVMRAAVITTTPDTPVEIAAVLMADNKIGALPVIDPLTDGLVGIISQTDLFAALARLLGGQVPGTRLELHVDDLPRQLGVLASMAQQHHVSINSLIALPGGENAAAGYTVVLRVGSIDPRQFIEGLRRADIHLSSTDEL
jgi:acetoin utilization protein AcuB